MDDPALDYFVRGFFLICNAVILFQGEYHINHTPESKKCWKGVGLSIIFKNKRNGTTSVCRLSYTQRLMIKYGQITQTVKITTTQKSAISILNQKSTYVNIINGMLKTRISIKIKRK